MLRYAITDRRMFAGDEGARTKALLEQAIRLQRQQVDFLQLREKDLTAGELLDLARRLREVLPADKPPRLLINGPVEIALQAGADGVHLPDGWTPHLLSGLKLAPILRGGTRPLGNPRHALPMLVSIACHAPEQARDGALAGADLILFSPVFEKPLGGNGRQAGVGLDRLHEAVLAARGTPVLALGGVNRMNADACVAHGAAGVAGIRLFLNED